MTEFHDGGYEGAIAIIGMAGRFPGAKDMDEFWKNLYEGVESVRFFTGEELLNMGIDGHLLGNPKFVAADAILEDMDLFDASFFDYSAREAEIMDPQHRLFLESAWEVLESAGYNSELYDGRVAVYAGANLSGYMIRNLYSNPGLVENIGTFKIMLANGQDFLATKVSYKMNLTGPSVNVNTLCSSSMVALHYACQNLQNYGCDIALAGGVSFQVSRNEAFFYQEGGIGSSDGHCRAFDSKANGTVSGSGLAVVVLKRLEDAIADRDHIHAVIRGTGINNDGSSKNSYTAPNVDGQAECIAEAIAMSGVDPETITYIDAHGTGTDLGDPIEIAALTKAFRAHTKKKQFCAIGSVKTNIGHLVNAGGLASVVKTVLSMKHRVIPPSLNFEKPNPKIDFVNSPFYVNKELSKWETKGFPLRAGVSSFGIGGTNTHVILEEAPAMEPWEKSPRPYHLIALSAKTETALERMTANLLGHIQKNPQLKLEDMAYTLQVGRRSFNHRRMIVCRNGADLLEKLEERRPEEVYTRFQKPKEQPVVFMFSGSDRWYVDMGLELYVVEKCFRDAVDHCFKVLEDLTGEDMKSILYPEKGHVAQLPKGERFDMGRGLVFAVEYGLAKLWMDLGVEPQYMLGKGAGEYVAACLAEVLTLKGALKLAIASPEAIHEAVSSLELKEPKIPFISCVTGELIEDGDTVSKEYWVRQRQAWDLNRKIKELVEDPDSIIIAMGSERIFNTAIVYGGTETDPEILYSMEEEGTGASQEEALLKALGRFWLAGKRVDWNRLYAHEKRCRIPLPTYPFERQRYWIEPGKGDASSQQPHAFIGCKDEVTDELVNSRYGQGSIKVTVKLDSETGAPGKEGHKKQLEDMLLFRERLKELAKEFRSICSDIEISEVGLEADGSSGYGDRGSTRNLKKRPRPQLDTPYAPPENEEERIIVGKWQEVLGFDTIGRNDDFFELGGHSLIAAAVAMELSKVFNVQIPMRQLFEITTAAGIAELIGAYRWAESSREEPAASSEELESGTI